MRAATAGLLAWALWSVATGLVVAAAVTAPAAFFGVPGAANNAGDLGAVMAMVGLVFVTVGAFLGARRPGNPVGWLLAGSGWVMTFMVFAAMYTSHGGTGSRPGAEWVAWAAGSIWHPAFALLVFVLLLFPDGRLPTPRWRPFAFLAVVAYALLAVASALSPATVEFYFPDLRSPVRSPVDGVATAVVDIIIGSQLLLVITAMAAQVVRLRRTHGRERQQISWFVYAVVVSVVVFLGGFAVLGGGHLFPVFGAIPVAAGYAILRHRLYDIDRVIRRTFAYAVLTLLLAGVYVGAVLLITQVLPRSSSLAVATSTLAVAAVFQPARHRIQRAVDRRFNRRSYDAGRIIDALGVRLRDQVDLDALHHELLEVAQQAMEPAAVSLWLSHPPDAPPVRAGGSR